MTNACQPLEPDTKDWTWTLERACPECGFDASALPTERLQGALTEQASGWGTVLAGAGAALRPRPTTWSVLEYACHVRDVCRLFTERTQLMLSEIDPVFPEWDGDAASLDYGASDPARVALEVRSAIESYAEAHDGLAGSAWERSGVRGDGKRFTVDALARYGLHELVHHGWDAGIPPQD